MRDTEWMLVSRRAVLAGKQTERESAGRLGRLGAELTAAQQQHVEAMRGFEREMAEIGREQGRSYGESLSLGLKSQLSTLLLPRHRWSA